MSRIVRSLGLISRVQVSATPNFARAQRFAHQSYGNEQSGHEQGINEPNPKRHMEHPGPEAPSTKGSSSQTSPSQSSSTKTSNEAQPTINQPKSAAEATNPEVRKHNEEMRNRHDVSANQLSEKDNKVDKSFWKGDVGDIQDPAKKQ